MSGAHAQHGTEHYWIEGEGYVGGEPPALPDGTDTPPGSGRRRAPRQAAPPPFRFSRMGPQGTVPSKAVLRKVARAMATGDDGVEGRIPAGYTYLGQFVDHDLTFDKTSVMLGDDVSVADLIQGRSPTLDLDSVYGAGPADPGSAAFYRDSSHLKIGRTVDSGDVPALTGYDLKREGDGSPGSARRALIPDHRNDENLAVGQTHVAMVRLHNRVVDALPDSVPANQRFRVARREVVLHYQWMLRHDYLPRIVDKAIVDDVFSNGRRVFEAGADPLSMPTMPVEFSVAAFRMGHSMIRGDYEWNRVFNRGGAPLELLFNFSGTSGFLGGGTSALPSNWIADWRRLYRFSDIGRSDLAAPRNGFNKARRIDTRLALPLASLPAGSFGGTDDDLGTLAAHLAFRNLTRAGMVKLATGQQMAALLRSAGVPVAGLTKAQLIGAGNDSGAALTALTEDERTRFARTTPLWFWILREAELNDGRLTGVGGRIVAETFHRAMEGSAHSIVRNSGWRPSWGEGTRFTMMDLLLKAYPGSEEVLNPVG